MYTSKKNNHASQSFLAPTYGKVSMDLHIFINEYQVIRMRPDVLIQNKENSNYMFYQTCVESLLERWCVSIKSIHLFIYQNQLNQVT